MFIKVCMHIILQDIELCPFRRIDNEINSLQGTKFN